MKLTIKKKNRERFLFNKKRHIDEVGPFVQKLGEASIFFFLHLLERSGQRRGPSSWRAPLLILFSGSSLLPAQIYLLGIRILLVFYQEASPMNRLDHSKLISGAHETLWWHVSMMDARGHDKRSFFKKKEACSPLEKWPA